MKKILFSDKYGLTRAVLEGRKTQTRRVVPDSTLSVAARDVAVLGGDFNERIIEHSPYLYNEVVAVAQSYKSIGDELGLSFFLKDEYKTSAGMTNKMFVKADLMLHYIRITNIRIERLQDISNEDCLAEGIEVINGRTYTISNIKGVELFTDNAQLAYEYLIDKVSGKGTWDSNPYVFVYEFKLEK